MLVYDLFCGLFGWGSAFAAEGWRVVGFDIMDASKEFGIPRPEGCELRIRDVLTIHGSELVDADAIVASPPCQFFSYCAMPWKRAKELAKRTRASAELMEKELALFKACFRIQREALAAAGRHIPMVVENVRGAQPWVGRAAWNFGSFYLWGDVPALMPFTRRAQKFNPDGTGHPPGSWFAIADSKERGIKAGDRNKDGNGWNHSFADQLAEREAMASEGRKLGPSPGKRWEDRPVSVAAHREYEVSVASALEIEGQKVPVYSDPRRNGSKGVHLTSLMENERGVKVALSGRAWYADGLGRYPSASNSRRRASALIAKIPEPPATGKVS